MKVSLNIVKQYINVDVSVDDLVSRINQQLGQVEEVINLTEKYAAPIVVKVVSCVDHPDSDHMHVCRVDDGGVVADVERDEEGLVQVVCGAPNVHAGMFAAWLPPKSTVPSSYDEKELFVLGSRELRGEMSHGMLASPRELALGDDHEGILEISESDLPPELETSMNEDYEIKKPTKPLELKPGVSFSKLFGLDDTIIVIENKMFTHRPDLFGQFGIARELFAILQPAAARDKHTDIRFNEREWYWRFPHFEEANSSELDVFNDATDKVPRFMAVALENVTIGQSPIWLRAELVRLGSKPINNVVDITNYIMLLTAQPTHAYDYDKIRGHRLGARMARQGEKTTLLNGKTYTLDTDDIVIADGDGVIGLAGIMGGLDSEVSQQTKRIILEVGTFDMYAVRKSGMRHGVFTEALTRFNKGQSPLQNDRVLYRLMQLAANYAGASQASNVYDVPELVEGSFRVSESAEVYITPEFINERLGLELTEEQIGNILRFVNFATYRPEEDPSKLLTAAPFWRTDIELPEDIVEEVGRLYGFDKLPRELPMRSIKPATKNPVFEMKHRVRDELSRAGANEVLTYSFVHENTLKKVGQDPEQAFKLGNALSPDLQYYRLSVLPSLLDKVHGNIKSGYDEFALFEFGKAHRKGDNDNEGLPREYGRLAFVYAAKKSDKAAYYVARRYAETIIPNVRYSPLESFEFGEFAVFEQLAKPFDPKRSAVLMDGDHFVGVIGEFRSAVRKGFKLPDHSAGFELFQSYLLKQQPKAYTPLSRYPSVTQDISLRVSNSMPQDKLFQVARDALQAAQPAQTTMHLETIGIYQPDDAATKTITLRLKVASYERTLTDAEVTTFLDVIAHSAEQNLQATRV